MTAPTRLGADRRNRLTHAESSRALYGPHRGQSGPVVSADQQSRSAAWKAFEAVVAEQPRLWLVVAGILDASVNGADPTAFREAFLHADDDHWAAIQAAVGMYVEGWAATNGVPYQDAAAVDAELRRLRTRDHAQRIHATQKLQRDGIGQPAPSITLDELLAGDDPEYDWLIPGLLERGDRAVITGDEGKGKSTWLRQMGLGAAAGVNPFATSLFDGTPEPISVLAVDCENSTRQLRREYPKVRRALHADQLAVADRHYHLAVRTEGIVLDQPDDPTGDRAWLQAEIAQHKPAILFLGPLYKLMGGDPNKEAEARLLALYLDRVRGINAQVAVVIEAHAPHGQQRPYGWSGWKRWPEFGLHLSEDGSVSQFRGGRDDDRHWPRQLRRGRKGEWLWVPTNQPATIDPEDEYDAGVRQIVQRVLTADAEREFTAKEIIARANRRPGAARKALAHFEDHGWLVRGERRAQRSDGRAGQAIATYRLDPDGPAGTGR
jgi:hypothetical protein